MASIQKISLAPFLKWAGGKRQVLPFIRRYAPRDFKTYYEPFVGAGAVLFDLQPRRAHINDANSELINCYRAIQDRPEELIRESKRHKNTREYFYALRELDRSPDYAKLSEVARASRIIYLNKTCFNGLYRVNRRGYFNVPFGRYKNPIIVDAEMIRAISRYLNTNAITITNLDFERAVEHAGPGDFVYFDPPYDPISSTASFTSYHLGNFSRADQERLKVLCDRLVACGCYVMISNSSTEFIMNLYREYNLVRILARRNINSVASGRGAVDEILAMSYELDFGADDPLSASPQAIR